MSRSDSKHRIDFIGIGAQKAGTSWLYHRLDELPHFGLPPIKELHYFDRDPDYPSTNKLEEVSLSERLNKPSWALESLRRIGKCLLFGDLKRARWFANWYYADYDDDWYLSLFGGNGALQGEITPGYAILKEKDIRRMHRLAPEARLIFIMRNPVERAWSHFRYRMHKTSRRSIGDYSSEEIIRFMESRRQASRSDYLTTLDRYLKYYPEEQFLLCFYDGIRRQPLQLLSEVVQFLNVSSANIQDCCDIKKTNNVSPKHQVPDEVEIYLKTKYYPQIKTLSDRYGGYCRHWYQELYHDGGEKINADDLKPTIALKRTGNSE